MPQIKNMKIQAEGERIVYFLFAATILGVLDMIEKERISYTDASMVFFLPIMIRTGENTMIHRICSMAEELDTYPPTQRKGETEEIRELCYDMMAEYSRIDTLRKAETISFDFQHNNTVD